MCILKLHLHIKGCLWDSKDLVLRFYFQCKHFDSQFFCLLYFELNWIVLVLSQIPYSKEWKKIWISLLESIYLGETTYFIFCSIIIIKNVFFYWQITNGPGPDPPIMSRPPSSVGPNSLLSTPGLGRKVKPLLNNNNNNRMVDGGWQSVGAMHPNKFQMKRPKKKYIEPGTSVICIHTKVMYKLGVQSWNMKMVFLKILLLGLAMNINKWGIFVWL